MKYALISTYPQQGSRNIGDKLIETSMVRAIRAMDTQAQIDTIWRADTWENVRQTVSQADHVIFCLAIRTGMDQVYPYLAQVMDTGVPFSAISAGTSLRPYARNMMTQGFSVADLDILRRFAGQARLFTTRGALTQAFCEANGLAGAELTGDVAFVDPRFDGRRFERLDEVRRIVISDPHDGPTFAPAFSRLVEVLRALFPDAAIDCVLHGDNTPIEKLAARSGLTVRPIYKDPDTGLDTYDDYDLHAGFRVHGHVSALTRRIPSYLLEQDGRGCDYGLTLERKISVPCYRVTQTYGTRTTQILRLIRGQSITRPVVHPSAADILGALIARDASQAFEGFLGLERTLEKLQRSTTAAIGRICQPDML